MLSVEAVDGSSGGFIGVLERVTDWAGVNPVVVGRQTDRE